MFGKAIYNGENVLIIDRVSNKYLIHYGGPIWVIESELQDMVLFKNHPDDKFYSYPDLNKDAV